MAIYLSDFDAGNYAETTYFDGHGYVSVLAPDYKKAKEYVSGRYPIEGIVKARGVRAERITSYDPKYDNAGNCIKLYTERIGRIYIFDIDIEEFYSYSRPKKV